MIETVLFDLDGTILDTNELIIESFIHVMEGKMDPPLTRERLIHQMGKPLAMQMRYFSGRGEQEPVDDLIREYRAYNLRRHDELVRPFPYVKEVLQSLKDSGIRLGVVTSKIRLTSDKGLTLCGIKDYMETIVTIEDVQHAKPHPEPVLEALKRMNAKPETALMVGDSPFDIESAHQAGVQAVGVAWSLKGAEVLSKYNPEYVIDDMRELLKIVQQ
ncbi:pyrophosphatase PpaX [Marinicrinis lubricantis]|uniref:Pyrophosphatase PpaX n=1 Tax=Marinicrinis lubricantis TaxID=2086470 RepID=A0ABW1IPK3_9BACL